MERLIITLNDLAEKHNMSIDEIDNYITEHKKIEQESEVLDTLDVYVNKATIIYNGKTYNPSELIKQLEKLEKVWEIAKKKTGQFSMVKYCVKANKKYDKKVFASIAFSNQEELLTKTEFNNLVEILEEK